MEGTKTVRKILDTTRSDDALSVGLNAALHTLSAWPVSGSPIGLPARGVTLAIRRLCWR
jgi:hypothetical protein